MPSSQTNSPTWPDLAIGLYDKLTGRGAQITYEFDGLEVKVPASAEDTSPRATWHLNGAVKIRTSDDAS